jgi:uncharacterized membrane protein
MSAILLTFDLQGSNSLLAVGTFYHFAVDWTDLDRLIGCGVPLIFVLALLLTLCYAACSTVSRALAPSGAVFLCVADPSLLVAFDF